MRKKLLAFALAVAMALSCVGCSDTAASGGSMVSTGGTSGSATSTATDEPITLTLMDQFVEGEGMTEAFRARLEVFKQEHPNVTIEEETLNTADMGTKVQTLAAADELPDIFQMKGQMAKSFVENGYVMDLTDILSENSEWVDGFRDGVFSNFEIGDGTYAVPYQVTNTFVFYNSALFEQAGITEFPTTWDGLIEACEKLSAVGITPIELGNSPLWPAESVIMSTLGNRCTGDEWYQSLRNNTGSKFTDEEFVLSLQSLYDLAATGAFNSDVNSIDGDAQRAAFMNGQAAIMFDGSWAVSALDANMEDDMKTICQPLDFYGQNIYRGIPTRMGTGGQPEKVAYPQGGPRTAIGWHVNFDCLYWGTKFLYERYKTPIYITENGMSAHDWPDREGKVHDPQRIDYLCRHLAHLRRACEDGIDVRGYFEWSLLDNFEWKRGYNDRFGLVYVDFVTQQRIPKDSFAWYARTIKENGENL